MGIVIEEIKAILAGQIEQHGVVVWFDPEQAYAGALSQLAFPGVVFKRCDPQQGFLRLRRDLEPLWSGAKPRLLIYVPLASAETHNALVEYIVSGVKLEPGAHPIERNTRLAVVARHALEKVLPPASVEKVVDDIQHNRLTLKEIEEIAEKGLELQTGALAVIFASSNPEEVALRFLTDPALDADLISKSAGPALAELLGAAFGFQPPASATTSSTSPDLPGLRAALARHLLLVEFLDGLGASIPPALKSMPLPANKAARESAVRVVRTWRLRRDLAAAYEKAAQKLEIEAAIAGAEWTVESLLGSETFLRCERALQSLLEVQLAAKAGPEAVQLARQRLAGFWSGQRPEVKMRWQIITTAGELLLLAGQILQALKANLPAAALFERYTGGDSPWCELDNLHRHLERDDNSFDIDAGHSDGLLKLAAAAQGRYAEAAQELALRFVKGFESAGFVLKGVTQQARVYADYVEPRLKTGKTAYLLVDAFRFEMARELCSQFPEVWQASLAPALATPPTITEVGMAALMPGAERGLTLAPAGPGKLGVKVDGSTLKNRQDRIQHLISKCGVPVAAAPLSEIAPLKDKTLRSKLANARLVVIIATEEIDGLWENHPAMARQLQNHAFEQLRRGIRALFGLGVQRVVVSADHGFLAGSSLLVGEQVDSPGGDEADLHRRVWVGKGGAAVPNFLRRPVSAFGLGGDLELVTPYSLAVFKAGGSLAYFHGGLSLQELVIPVLTISSNAGAVDTGKPPFHWETDANGKKISNRFFSVIVKGNAENLLAQPPRVRVELRAGAQVISQPVAASYGYHDATRDVKMEFEAGSQVSLAPNTITLQITDIPEASKVSLYLLDEIGATLLEVAGIPIDIAF